MTVHRPIARPTLAERQAAWIEALRYEDIPEEVRARARLLLLDFLGVARLGSTLPQVAPARALLEIMATLPEASVIGVGGRATAAYAAYANGTFGHSCEYDDAHFDCGHPGVCVIPAALALAERTDASGRDLLVAIVAGYQAMVWSQGPVNRRTLDIGWHGMKIGGVFGAAAATAKLLGLTAEQTANALAIAGSDASGTMEYDQSGGEVKRFHAGMASRAGVQAALLAQAGLTGPVTIFEGPRGIHNLFTERQPKDAEGYWDGSFHILRTMVKLHPMVGTTHGVLDALGMVLDRRPARAEEIERIECGIVDWAIPHGAAIVHPHDMLSAQFSLAFACALRVAKGRVLIRDLADPACWRDEALKALASRVEPVAIEVPADAVELCGGVTVHFRDGTVEAAFQPAPRGYPTNPAAAADIEAKFLNVVDGLLSGEQARRVVAMAADVDALPTVGPLIAAIG
ncbi:MmgE/PrpD family protein [Sphingomonas sp. C8-2]|nr:MmgE/PrpD family protein [Sphingomonas sp. C8-2]